MVVEDAGPRRPPLGPWDASAYPNIRVVAPSDADLAGHAPPDRWACCCSRSTRSAASSAGCSTTRTWSTGRSTRASARRRSRRAWRSRSTGSDGLTSTHRAHHDVLAKLIRYAAPADFDPLDGRPRCRPPSRTLVLATLAEVLGLEQGLCGGRGGSMHLAHPGAGVVTSAIVGGGIPRRAVRRWRPSSRATAAWASRRSVTARPPSAPSTKGSRSPGRWTCRPSSCWRTTATRWPPRCARRQASSSWPSVPRATTCPRSSWTAWTRSRCSSRWPRARAHAVAHGPGVHRGEHLPLLPPERAAAGQRLQVPDARRGEGLGDAGPGRHLPAPAGRDRAR